MTGREIDHKDGSGKNGLDWKKKVLWCVCVSRLNRDSLGWCSCCRTSPWSAQEGGNLLKKDRRKKKVILNEFTQERKHNHNQRASVSWSADLFEWPPPAYAAFPLSTPFLLWKLGTFENAAGSSWHEEPENHQTQLVAFWSKRDIKGCILRNWQSSYLNLNTDTQIRTKQTLSANNLQAADQKQSEGCTRIRININFQSDLS